MKVYERAKRLIAWMRRHEPATIAQIVAGGMMDRREASQTVLYCVRYGVLEKVSSPASGRRERARYRLTDRDLPAPKQTADSHSFDSLLSAWGICKYPAVTSGTRSRKA
jgi:hypothetical protein